MQSCITASIRFHKGILKFCEVYCFFPFFTLHYLRLYDYSVTVIRRSALDSGG